MKQHCAQYIHLQDFLLHEATLVEAKSLSCKILQDSGQQKFIL